MTKTAESTRDYAGFDSPLAAVLSGQFELCVAHNSLDHAFIRNGMFKTEDGKWSKLVCIPVSRQDAEAISRHKCMVHKTGYFVHFHTRRFCVKPDVLVSGEENQ